jgi:predicted LPLAT superfamily acyltransferase
MAKFPLGPFLLGSRLKVPVLFVYVIREPKRHYHLYASRVEVIPRNAQDLLEKYTENVSQIVKKYPLQWFNFYDFWGDAK